MFTTADQKRASSLIVRSAAKKTSAGAAKKLTERVDGVWRITEEPPIRTHRETSAAGAVYQAYRDSLDEDRRHLLDRFTAVDGVPQIVGVGSIGMRVYLVLLNGEHDNDPLFLQMKQAGPSVYEPFCGASVPLRWAIFARDQCVAFVGTDSSVATTTSWTCSAVMLAGRPGRSSSVSPSRRCSMNRARHLPTVAWAHPNSAATVLLSLPSAQASTIRDRNAKACDDLPRRAHRRS